jgi:hypothetical protein
MGKDKTVWIQNNHSGDILIRAKTEAEGTGRINITERLFGCYRIDRMTGQVRHSGYTELAGAEYTFLREHSPLFKKFLDEARLTKYDTAPPGAVNAAEQLILLRAENAQLKKELDAAKKAGGGDVTGLTGEIEALRAELDTVMQELDAVTAERDALVKNGSGSEAAVGGGDAVGGEDAAGADEDADDDELERL